MTSEDGKSTPPQPSQKSPQGKKTAPVKKKMTASLNKEEMKAKALEAKKRAQEATEENIERAKGIGTRYLASLKSNRATQIITAISLLVVIGGYFAYAALTDKPMGTWRYGVCKVVAETYARYPSTIDILAAGEKSTSALLYYSDRNAFGDQRLHLMNCYYGKDEKGLYIKSVDLDEIPLDPEFIKPISDTMRFMKPEDFDLELPQGFTLDITQAKNRTALPLDPVFKHE